MRRAALACAVLAAATLSAQPPAPSPDSTPQSVDDFRAAATRVLEETGVPGAGIALVRLDAVEWEGGLGYADREQQIPVTADTGFRVGSISKTFVAMALVQLAEDGLLELDAPVRELLPDLQIDNPWEDEHPVRVIHLLQHTAGLGDMQFNEAYVPDGETERTLDDVLLINPRSRRVRWQPGTRMAYSNPGYGVAGLVLEQIADMPYEDYIDQEIFAPLDMTQSSFRLGPEDEARLARGYAGPVGPPVGYPRIYYRPAGNLHSTPRDMARFVQMLLGWGELGDAFVIDPEYLSNMEHPRTTLASGAALRSGYGSGIFRRIDWPYPVLGHDGGIAGFVSSYGYSPSRDVGFVVLLNSTGPRAGEALRRISTLALLYLKRDVEPPERPQVVVEPSVLDRYVGYYEEANPRNQVAWAVQRFFAGHEVMRDGDTLYLKSRFGERGPLVPVSETTFRRPAEVEASLVFTTTAEGTMVLAGGQFYAERASKFQADALRLAVLVALLVILSVVAVAMVWIVRIRRARPRGFWELKVALLLCPLALLAPAASLWLTPMPAWGTRHAGTITVFLATLGVPTLALVVSAFTWNAAREGASRPLITYAGCVALAMGSAALYLNAHGLLGLRLWSY